MDLGVVDFDRPCHDWNCAAEEDSVVVVQAEAVWRGGADFPAKWSRETVSCSWVLWRSEKDSDEESAGSGSGEGGSGEGRRFWE